MIRGAFHLLPIRTVRPKAHGGQDGSGEKHDNQQYSGPQNPLGLTCHWRFRINQEVAALLAQIGIGVDVRPTVVALDCLVGAKVIVLVVPILFTHEYVFLVYFLERFKPLAHHWGIGVLHCQRDTP